MRADVETLKLAVWGQPRDPEARRALAEALHDSGCRIEARWQRELAEVAALPTWREALTVARRLLALWPNRTRVRSLASVMGLPLGEVSGQLGHPPTPALLRRLMDGVITRVPAWEVKPGTKEARAAFAKASQGGGLPSHAVAESALHEMRLVMGSRARCVVLGAVSPTTRHGWAAGPFDLDSGETSASSPHLRYRGLDAWVLRVPEPGLVDLLFFRLDDEPTTLPPEVAALSLSS